MSKDYLIQNSIFNINTQLSYSGDYHWTFSGLFKLKEEDHNDQ
jgi:hypothetical protein